MVRTKPGHLFDWRWPPLRDLPSLDQLELLPLLYVSTAYSESLSAKPFFLAAFVCQLDRAVILLFPVTVVVLA